MSQSIKDRAHAAHVRAAKAAGKMPFSAVEWAARKLLIEQLWEEYRCGGEQRLGDALALWAETFGIARDGADDAECDGEVDHSMAKEDRRNGR